MAKRDFLSLADLSRAEFTALLARAAELKTLQKRGECPKPLAGKTLAMMFEKSSTRTRISFEVGTFQLGGHALMLKGSDLQSGRGESLHDTAKVMSRYVDGVMVRTYGHDGLKAFAEYADIPIINGLTDLLHPCQIVADLQTCGEAFGLDAISTLKVAWIGDGNNMAHSWMHAAEVLGFELTVACPEGYDPDPEILARSGATLVRDPKVAAAGANVITTDVWASMGQEEEAKARMVAFEGFEVTEAIMAEGADDAIFLHCLPAHRGEEVSAAVIDGPRSLIFDEAENRLHAQKAIMEWLMGGRDLL